MSKASLIVVGSGIKFMSHLTTEAKTYIEQSDKVFYLVNEPAMKTWIHKVNNNAESLDEIYNQHEHRLDSYHAITNFILEALRKKVHICVVVYGHPTVFAKPALDAVAQAQKEGYFAKILPGISTESCLFADLLIDPGTHGCLSLEATDILLFKRNIDPTCHLIIWQVSIIGALNHPRNYENKKGIKLLATYLKNYYEENHEIILYTAAQYPGLEPEIIYSTLKNLITLEISRISTLYIPPKSKTVFDSITGDILNIKLNDLKR